MINIVLVPRSMFGGGVKILLRTRKGLQFTKRSRKEDEKRKKVYTVGIVCINGLPPSVCSDGQNKPQSK